MKNALTLLVLAITSMVFGQTETAKRVGTTKPFVLGLIDEIQSSVLGERRILNIYLPEGYNSSSAKYPVIYLLDGSADEDFIHVVGLVQYKSFEWVNRVPKSTVVRIASVDPRRDLTFPTTIVEDQKKYPTAGHSEKFIAFIERELQPFIEKNYRTNSTKTIVGQSLGGLLATEILIKKPTLFNKYIIISPSLWWDNGSLLNFPVADIENKEIYLAVGKEGLTPTSTPRVMEDDVKLLSKKIGKAKAENANLLLDYLPEENHATIMHQAISNAFKVMFSNESENKK